MKFKTATSYETSGTHLQGYIVADYKLLYYIFGTPNYGPDSCVLDKSTCEWMIKFEDGTIATIYDWKTSETPTHDYNWHIGGFDKKAVELVTKTINSYFE